MKRLITFLLALMLTWIGANAQTVVHECVAVANDWSITPASPTSGDFHQNTWSTEADVSGMVQPFLEYWADANNATPLSAATISHNQLTGLTAGYYEVSLEIRVLNELGTSVGTGTKFTANDASEDLDDTTIDGNEGTFGTSNEVYGIYHLLATVTSEGTLDISITIPEDATYNWIAFKNLEVTYLGETPVGYVAHECEAYGDDWGKPAHWTADNDATTNLHVNKHSTEADPSGMVTPFVEYWYQAGTNLPDDVLRHDQLTGLYPGYYSVSIEVRAFNESGTTAITSGTTLNAISGSSSASVDITSAGLTSSTEFSGHYELYGTLNLIAEVTAASESTTGTLDIDLTVKDANYNWLSFKNLSVVYMGEELSYSIGEPQCAASCVKPGSEVSITFPNCITPTAGETPTLSTSVNITVGSTAVTGTLSYSGTTATVTFTIPESVGYGETVTVSVPAGLLSWSGTSVSSVAGTFTLTTPIMADQDGVYILSVYDNEFLSRGYNYGTAADVDRYGVPVNIVFGDDGTATVEYIDSKLYLYGPNWAWTDAEAANASHYTLVAVSGQEGVYQFLGGTGSDDAPMYVYDETAINANDNNTYRVANNGIKNSNYVYDEQTYWKILTRAERDAIKDAWVLGEYQEIAASFGATISSQADFEAFLAALGEGTDATEKVTGATLTNITANDTGSNGWGIKYPTENAHSGYGSSEYCTEMYQSDGDLYQNVEGLEPGLYKVTLNGFIRHGWYDTCAEYIDYDLSYAYLRANDYEINLVPWAWEAEIQSTNNYENSDPSTMQQAGSKFDDGKYLNTLFTIVGEDGKLSIEIDCPGYLSSEWTCIKNLTLTYYSNPDVVWEMTTANWGTLILPFAVEDVPTDLTIYTCSGTTTSTDTDGNVATTVTVTAVEGGIAANTPYLVKGNVEEDTYYTFSGTPEDATNGLTEGLLTGTFEDMDYDALVEAAGSNNTVYLLQDQGEGAAFYPVVTTGESSEATLTANHCYLTLSGSNNVRAYIGFPDSGEETGIVVVESDVIANDAIYDLSGRRVSKAVKGVYIQNGKKVLVK